jgi:rod shape-determining protein MreC
MHDRAVRRRRAVLVVLVAASLILLTAYFGESSNGSLHSVQRTAMGVLSPIQQGANRVLKPVRDLFGWFGDTIHAKSQRDQYKREAEAYRAKLAQTELALGQKAQLDKLQTQDTTGGMQKYAPVQAHVYLRSPNAFYQRLSITAGTSEGVHAGDPVIDGGGLLGVVLTATGGSAVVSLVTDQNFSVSALAGSSREPGSVQPAIGAPGDLLLNMVQDSTGVHGGDLVYTSGTVQSRLEDRYPPGILIGTVKRIDPGTGDLDRRIHIKPAADLRHADIVQVLTQPHADLRAAVQ